jgi:hypothetical protein
MTHENVFVAGQSSRTLPDWIPTLPENVKSPSTLRDDEIPASPTFSSSSSSPVCESSSEDSQTPFNPWPFAEALNSDRPYTVLSTPSRDNPNLEAVIVPIVTQSLATGDRSILGFILSGLNPNRLIDNDYLTFYSNVAKQFESGILNGKSRVSSLRLFATLIFALIAFLTS